MAIHRFENTRSYIKIQTFRLIDAFDVYVRRDINKGLREIPGVVVYILEKQLLLSIAPSLHFTFSNDPFGTVML
jgi:hypothetical protein